MKAVKIPAAQYDAAMAECNAILKSRISSKAIYEMRAKARKGAATAAKIITIYACNAAIQMIEDAE